MGWPNAAASGTALGCGEQLRMFDTFSSGPTNFLDAAERQYGGYTLAHEFGHYFYGLYDEYSDSKADCAKVGLITPCKDDQPVNNSMMTQQENAEGGSTTNTGPFAWLNFSPASTSLPRTPSCARSAPAAGTPWSPDLPRPARW